MSCTLVKNNLTIHSIIKVVFFKTNMLTYGRVVSPNFQPRWVSLRLGVTSIILPKAIGLGDGTFKSGSNYNRLYLHPGSLYPKQYTTFFRRRILVNIFTENIHHTPAKMSRGTNSILSEIEWDEGLSMPVANAENKVLEDQVKIEV